MYKSGLKRVCDCFLSFMAITVLSPILVVLTIIGFFAMKGNPFFTQLRPGLIDKNTGKERIFKLIKFRTMTNEKDKDGNLLPDEVRLNGYGKFLRSTSLDELPELFNIFIGDMAVIGPRPQLVKDMVFMSEEQRKRHTVRPGLSGLAQISGRNNVSWNDKFKYDLEYINNGIGPFKDIKIIILTVFKTLKREDIVREGTESDIDFGDYLLQSNMITKEEYDLKIQEANAILKENSNGL